jgi:hypothetical protein
MPGTKRWELVVSRKIPNTEKYANLKVGVIFENERGNLAIKIDQGIALVPGEGVTFNGFPPREHEGRFQPPPGRGPARTNPPSPETADEDWEV